MPLDRQQSERAHGKQKVAQMKRQQLLSLDDICILEAQPGEMPMLYDI